jgi:hypothetical protein
MRLSAAAALALGVILAAPIAAIPYVDATPIHKHRSHTHRAYTAVQTGKIELRSIARIPAEPAPSFFPHIAPYPPGQGDTDGLSRNPDDCNKGCIGGNPG